MAPHTSRRSGIRTSWDPVADWYARGVGRRGGIYHRRVVFPAVLELLRPQRGEHMLELGCGHGVLAPRIAATGARYTGVDASRQLIRYARKLHGTYGQFIYGDAAHLERVDGIVAGAFNSAVFMLSIQDMEPLDAVIRSAAWALRPQGRIVLLMTHPCFRVPRQSGWGWDRARKLQFRRVDRYLSPLAVPMKRFGAGPADATRSFHRPLHAYVNSLGAHGLLVDHLGEITAEQAHPPGTLTPVEARADAEIPLFLSIRALKIE